MSNPYGRAGKPKPISEPNMVDDADDDDVQEETSDITKTPEFEMAIAAERVRLFEEAKILARTELAAAAASGAANTSDVDSDIMKLARAFAMSSAEIADAGTNRKRVAPEIIEARKQSEKKLYALLDDVAMLPDNDPSLPIYVVIAETLIGDQLWVPFYEEPGRKGMIFPTRIRFCSIPNFAMKPENERAHAIYDAWAGTMAGSNGMTETPWGAHAQTWDALNAKPVWMTSGGRLTALPTQSDRVHGSLVAEPEIPVLGGNRSFGAQAQEQMSIHDPRRTAVPVLGTIAPPATRGSSDPRMNVR